jgi:hypothetical protein
MSQSVSFESENGITPADPAARSEKDMSQWRLTPGNEKSPLPPFSKGGY